MTRNSLSDTLKQAWACMEAGAAPGKSRFSMVQVANIGEDGRPRARTVVIRNVDVAARTLAFHTDRRSPKVKELQSDPRVTVVGYDMEAGQQVRIEGAARLHIADSEALAAWGESRAEARVGYRRQNAPGEALADPKMGDAQADALTPADQTLGFDRFCWVVIQATKVDWLSLSSPDHRRSIHRWNGADWDSSWVAP